MPKFELFPTKMLSDFEGAYVFNDKTLATLSALGEWRRDDKTFFVIINESKSLTLQYNDLDGNVLISTITNNYGINHIIRNDNKDYTYVLERLLF